MGDDKCDNAMAAVGWLQHVSESDIGFIEWVTEYSLTSISLDHVWCGSLMVPIHQRAQLSLGCGYMHI